MNWVQQFGIGVAVLFTTFIGGVFGVFSASHSASKAIITIAEPVSNQPPSQESTRVQNAQPPQTASTVGIGTPITTNGTPATATLLTIFPLPKDEFGAPVEVRFSFPPSTVSADIDFGDGSKNCLASIDAANSTNCTLPPADQPFTHIYTNPGTYSVRASITLPNATQPLLATTTITVLTIGASEEFGTIDQNSLTTTSGNPTITGTALNVSQVLVGIDSVGDTQHHFYFADPFIPVVNGQWSFTANHRTANVLGNNVVQFLSPGVYIVFVASGNWNFILASSTLTVSR